MPIFEYDCACGLRVDYIRSFADRDNPAACPTCGGEAKRVEISKVHCSPDGIYSYAPNLGSEQAFERKRNALRDGVKVYKKESS